MSTLIEMYRTDQYDSWEHAEKLGGVHSAIVTGDEYNVDEAVAVIHAACNMMDGGYSVETRVFPDYSHDFEVFFKAFEDCFGSPVSKYEAWRLISAPNSSSAGGVVMDAWLLWNRALVNTKEQS